MRTIPVPDYQLGILDELLAEGPIGPKKQRALRATAILQIAALARSSAALADGDHALLSLLLGRWSYALGDIDQELSELSDFLTAQISALARVMNNAPAAIVASLDRLGAAGILAADTGQAQADKVGVSFAPAFNTLEPTLAPLLYREFVELEGYELQETASHYLENIQTDLNELRQFRPKDLRVLALYRQYQDLRVQLSAQLLAETWPANAQSLYSHLDKLADFEERLTILGGAFSTGLRRELAERSTHKMLILGQHLAPPPPSDNDG